MPLNPYPLENDDTVLYIRKNGDAKLGIVTDVHNDMDDDVSEDEQEEHECGMLKKGRVRLEWFPNGKEEELDESKLVLIDRTLMVGETVQRRDRPHFVGTVIGADVIGDAAILPERKWLIRGLRNEEIVFSTVFDRNSSAASMIVYENWVGNIDGVTERVTCQLTGSGHVFELLLDDKEEYEIIDDTWKRERYCQYDNAQWYPSQPIKICLSLLRNQAIWDERNGSGGPSERLLRKIDMSPKKFVKAVVKTVKIDSIHVSWISSLPNMPNSLSPIHPPSEVLEGAELDKVTKLDNFEHYLVQIADRISVKITESRLSSICRLSDWRKRLVSNVLTPVSPSVFETEKSGTQLSGHRQQQATIGGDDGVNKKSPPPENFEISENVKIPEENLEIPETLPPGNSGCTTPDSSLEEDGTSSSVLQMRMRKKRMNSLIRQTTRNRVPKKAKFSAAFTAKKRRPQKRPESGSAGDSAGSGPEHLLGQDRVAEMVHVRSCLTVRWQDGSVEKWIPASDLTCGVAELDDHLFVPGDLVNKLVDDEPNNNPNRELDPAGVPVKQRWPEHGFGVVARVDALERVALVNWFEMTQEIVEGGREDVGKKCGESGLDKNGGDDCKIFGDVDGPEEKMNHDVKTCQKTSHTPPLGQTDQNDCKVENCCADGENSKSAVKPEAPVFSEDFSDNNSDQKKFPELLPLSLASENSETANKTSGNRVIPISSAEIHANDAAVASVFTERILAICSAPPLAVPQQQTRFVPKLISERETVSVYDLVNCRSCLMPGMFVMRVDNFPEPNVPYVGQFLDVNEMGGIVVRWVNGTTETVNSAEIVEVLRDGDEDDYFPGFSGDSEEEKWTDDESNPENEKNSSNSDHSSDSEWETESETEIPEKTEISEIPEKTENSEIPEKEEISEADDEDKLTLDERRKLVEYFSNLINDIDILCANAFYVSLATRQNQSSDGLPSEIREAGSVLERFFTAFTFLLDLVAEPAASTHTLAVTVLCLRSLLASAEKLAGKQQDVSSLEDLEENPELLANKESCSCEQFDWSSCMPVETRLQEDLLRESGLSKNSSIGRLLDRAEKQSIRSDVAIRDAVTALDCFSGGSSHGTARDDNLTTGSETSGEMDFEWKMKNGFPSQFPELDLSRSESLAMEVGKLRGELPKMPDVLEPSFPLEGGEANHRPFSAFALFSAFLENYGKNPDMYDALLFKKSDTGSDGIERISLKTNTDVWRFLDLAGRRTSEQKGLIHIYRLLYTVAAGLTPRDTVQPIREIYAIVVFLISSLKQTLLKTCSPTSDSHLKKRIQKTAGSSTSTRNNLITLLSLTGAQTRSLLRCSLTLISSLGDAVSSFSQLTVGASRSMSSTEDRLTMVTTETPAMDPETAELMKSLGVIVDEINKGVVGVSSTAEFTENGEEIGSLEDQKNSSEINATSSLARLNEDLSGENPEKIPKLEAAQDSNVNMSKPAAPESSKSENPQEPKKTEDSGRKTSKPTSSTRFEMKTTPGESHKFLTESFAPEACSKAFLRAVGSELKILSTSLPCNILVKGYEDRMDLYSCMILGSRGTPFDRGCFIFDVCLKPAYPNEPPAVFYRTFSSEQLNPNLYQDGKVCVSLLGTWNGKDSEMWNPGSNLLQVFVSIQGLILNSEPFFNEAGFETKRAQEDSREKSRRFNEMALLRNLESLINVVRLLPAPFEDDIKQHAKTVIPGLLTDVESWISNSVNPGFPLQPCSQGFVLSITPYVNRLRNVVQQLE